MPGHGSVTPSESVTPAAVRLSVLSLPFNSRSDSEVTVPADHDCDCPTAAPLSRVESRHGASGRVPVSRSILQVLSNPAYNWDFRGSSGGCYGASSARHLNAVLVDPRGSRPLATAGGGGPRAG